MSKMISITALAIILFAMGCQPEFQDERFQTPKKTEQQVNQFGYMPATAGEGDMIEEMGHYRNSYSEALEKLVRYYAKTGDQTKLSWARNELKYFNQMPKYMYITTAELGGSELRATDLIVEADELYKQASKLYNDAILLVVVVDENKLRLALSKFNELIRLYPTSTKIDDAAYLAGRVHDHFKDYKIAAVYYQRAFQWNEATRYPARSRAAYIMDKRLNDKEKALALYQLAYKYEKHFPTNVEYAKERILALTKGETKLDNDKTAVPGDGVEIEDIEVPNK